jgi:hypothetical protein
MERAAAKASQSNPEASLDSARVSDLKRRLALISDAEREGRPVDIEEYLAGRRLFASSA